MEINSISNDSLRNEVKNALSSKQHAEHWPSKESRLSDEDCQLIRITEVTKLTTLSKSTVALWVAQGRFPKPINLSPTVKVWRISDIDKWINEHFLNLQEINSN